MTVWRIAEGVAHQPSYSTAERLGQLVRERRRREDACPAMGPAAFFGTIITPRAFFAQS